MRIRFPVVSLVMVGVLFSAGKASAQESKPEIKLIKVKASEFEKALAAHPGKVVVVDVWASFCLPCMKKFPHLVQLHKQFAKEGLVCISLSADIDDDGYAEALKFLQKQGATFPNYMLVDTEENKDKLEKTFPHNGIPIVHVFDRKGKKIQTWDTKIDDAEIDELVKKLLKESK